MSRTITVLTGGSTPERDVALAGAAQVVAALRDGGHTVRAVDTAYGELSSEREAQLLHPDVKREPPGAAALEDLAKLERAIDLVTLDALANTDMTFLVLHGAQVEGGALQEQLDAARITYTGSDPAGSRLAMDKDVAKRRLEDVGIPTPAWVLWPADDETVRSFGFPLIVKPSKAGSSLGLNLVKTPNDLPAAIREAQTMDDKVLIEAFLPGRDLTIGILDGRALTVGEIIPQHEIFDYECKYTPGLTEEVFPAAIDAALAKEIQRLGETAHRALGLRDFSRVDFRLDAEGRPHCIEANTLPGMTATSLLPQSAAASGLPFGDLCAKLVELALRRARHGNKVPG